MKKINLTGEHLWQNLPLFHYLCDNVLLKNDKFEREEELRETNDWEKYPDAEYYDKYDWEEFLDKTNYLDHWLDWEGIIDRLFNKSSDVDIVKQIKDYLESGEIKLKEEAEFIDVSNLTNDSIQKSVCDSFSKRYNK